MIDELAVPDRLEDAVCESQREHVLDRFLAQVVVDPEELVLGEPLADDGVELLGRGQVASEGLLDDEARPALLPGAPLADLAHHYRKGLRRNGEVVQPVSCGAVRPVELREDVADRVLAGVVGEVGRDVADARGELVEDIRAIRVARVALDRVAHRGDERPGRLLRPGNPDDRELLRQQAAIRHRVEGRNELALGQVTRRAEDHDRAGVGPAAEAETFLEGVLALAHRVATASPWCAGPRGDR